jgi:hypothetical protein
LRPAIRKVGLVFAPERAFESPYCRQAGGDN